MNRRHDDPTPAATRGVIEAYELKIKVLEAQLRILRWDLDKALAALLPLDRPNAGRE